MWDDVMENNHTAMRMS